MAPKSTKTTKTRTTRETKPARVQAAPQSSKPVFRTGTWVAVLLFAAVIAAAVYMNRQADEAVDAEATPVVEETFLFNAPGNVSSIEVKPLDGDTIKLERNESQAWVFTQPEEAEADQGLVEAAASQIAVLRIVTEVDNSKDPAIFGFDEPAYVITIGFEDGTTSILEVGDTTPSENGYYVRKDGDKFYVVAIGGLGALTNLVTTPPYLSTPAPEATATP